MAQTQHASLQEEALLDQVAQAVARQLNISQEQVTLQSRFIEDLGMDSIEFLQLLSILEDECGIYIPDERFEAITTVADAVHMIAELKA